MSDTDTLIGYTVAALIAAGGTIGYVKRGSVPSVVAGTVSGGLLALGVYQQTQDPRRVGLILGVSALLFVTMTKRAVRSKKLMPSGLVAALSALVLVRFGPRLKV
ncbi:hypothetical protein ACM66B_001277 [Microbotryomycetes sp. NB124-2]